MILNSSSKDRKIRLTSSTNCGVSTGLTTHQEGQINRGGHLPIQNIVQTQLNLADAGVMAGA